MDLTNISVPHDTSYDCEWNHEWKILWEEREQFSWWFGDVGLTTLACCGSSLDLLAISILKTEKHACSFNDLLCFVSIIDICFLVSSMMYNVVNTDTNMYSTFWTAILLIYVIGPLRSISMYASVYMTVALSYDRYKAISMPQEYRIQERLASSSMCGELTRPITYTIKALIPSIVFYLPQFFMFEIRQHTSPCDTKDLTSMITLKKNISCNTIKYSIGATELRTNDQFRLWYLNFGNLIFTLAIPLFLIIVFNVITYRKVKFFRKRQRNLQREESKQIDMAYQLFVFILLFTVSHALRIILNVTEYLTDNYYKKLNRCVPPSTSFWLRVTIPPISSFMISFFAASNFFVYVLFNEDFRITLKERLENLFKCFCGIQLALYNRNIDLNRNLNSNNPHATNAIAMGSIGVEPNIAVPIPH